MRKLQTAFLFATTLTALFTADLPAQEPVPLPVRKVMLYKNGMGYFEHLGPVTGGQAVEISLPGSQLNDVLKSLTVIDMDGGRISGVTYDSAAPLQRRLGELPIDLGQAQSLVGFLNQVRGAEVRIQTPGGQVAGRLMGAELRARTAASGATVNDAEASILSPQGELKLVELETAGALQFTEPAFAADMYRYLDLLSTRHRRDVRQLRIQTVGSGERRLFVGYTSESPIWKTTYRIVLDANRKPLLQGWAIVDNTTPVDWIDVSLSLIAGAPVSFIQNLAQPIYGRRPVVPLPEGVQVRPQLHEGTMDAASERSSISGSVRDPDGTEIPGAAVRVLDASGNILGEAVTDRNGAYRIEIPPGSYRVAAQLAGYQNVEYRGIEVGQGRATVVNFSLRVGSVAESVAVDEMPLQERRLAKSKLSAGGLTGAAPPMEAFDRMREAQPAAAEAKALGEQFEYKLSRPVTIRRNESGLLPIVHAEVEGEKVTLYNGDTDETRPRLAVWLKNTSGLTLDAGAFTVIDANAFAGEGLVETVQPGESRLLSYALDLGVEVRSDIEPERQHVERVEINRGVLRMHSKLTEKKSYVVRNNDAKPRTVVLEHPVREGWKLVDTSPPAESSASYYRFRLEAGPKTTAEFTVREETPQVTTYGITSITSEQITIWLREKSIDPEIESALSAVTAKKAEINELARKKSELENEQNVIFRDQGRVRDNLQRLGGTAEEAALRQRYVRQLDQQENRLAALRTELDKLEKALAEAQQQLDEMLQKLSFDRKL